ncbi:MAG: hypothetical protein JWN25_3328 [Verrucomicrobiales bacterium]|nr:hypothetical protein [Verrucomicrobiales bacterium]
MHYFNLKFWAPFLAVMGFSLFAGLMIAEQAQYGVIKLIVGVVMVLFFFTSARWWWVLIPAAFASGTVLWFGFKLYLHEVFLLMSILPLIFAIALNKNGMMEKRRPLLLMVKLLVAYLLIHMGWSLFWARLSGEGGFGNILRAYFGFMWGVGFVFLFHLVGKTEFSKMAFYLLYGTLIFRMGMTLLTYFFPAFNYIPVINLILPGSAQSTDDLRLSGAGAACCALCAFSFTRNSFVRAINFGIAIFSVGALLMGGGRVAVVSFLVFPLLFAWVNRLWIWFAGFFAMTVALLAFLNVSPRAIDTLEPRMQRTLSILVFDSTHGDIMGTEGSDVWHSELRRIALERWLSSPWTFLFGNRIKKFDSSSYPQSGNSDINFQLALNQAADLGAYESGWFTVIATAGFCGILLVAGVLVLLIRKIYPIIRKEGVRSPALAFCFLGFYYMIIWVVFGWAAGGFPTNELVLSIVGLYTFGESAKQRGLVERVVEKQAPAIFAHPIGVH